MPKIVIMLNNFLIADRAMPWRQLITRPTRVDNNSATLIDNIFTNKCSEYYANGHNISDMTDHFSQCWIFQSSIERTQPVKVTPLDYSKFSKQKFLQPNLSQTSAANTMQVDIIFLTWPIIFPSVEFFNHPLKEPNPWTLLL